MRLLLLFLTFCGIVVAADPAENFFRAHDPSTRYGTTTKEWDAVKGQIAGSRTLFIIDTLTKFHHKRIEEIDVKSLNGPHQVIDPLEAAAGCIRDESFRVDGQATDESNQVYLRHALSTGTNTAALYNKRMGSSAAWNFFVTDYGVYETKKNDNEYILRLQLAALAYSAHRFVCKEAKDLSDALGEVRKYITDSPTFIVNMQKFVNFYENFINGFWKSYLKSSDSLKPSIYDKLVDIYWGTPEIKKGKKAHLSTKRFFNVLKGELLSYPRPFLVRVTKNRRNRDSAAIVESIHEVMDGALVGDNSNYEYEAGEDQNAILDSLVNKDIVLGSPYELQSAILAFGLETIKRPVRPGDEPDPFKILANILNDPRFRFWPKTPIKERTEEDGVVLTHFLEGKIPAAASSSGDSSKLDASKGKKKRKKTGNLAKE